MSWWAEHTTGRVLVSWPALIHKCPHTVYQCTHTHTLCFVLSHLPSLCCVFIGYHLLYLRNKTKLWTLIHLTNTNHFSHSRIYFFSTGKHDKSTRNNRLQKMYHPIRMMQCHLGSSQTQTGYRCKLVTQRSSVWCQGWEDNWYLTPYCFRLWLYNMCESETELWWEENKPTFGKTKKEVYGSELSVIFIVALL